MDIEVVGIVNTVDLKSGPSQEPMETTFGSDYEDICNTNFCAAQSPLTDKTSETADVTAESESSSSCRTYKTREALKRKINLLSAVQLKRKSLLTSKARKVKDLMLIGTSSVPPPTASVADDSERLDNEHVEYERIGSIQGSEFRARSAPSPSNKSNSGLIHISANT
ncbi:hypothetical protein Trydic_g6776 [Trypoxylus dichotomus]